MSDQAMIKVIAEILCTECEGVSYDSLPESVKYLECRADGGRAIADKDSARIIAREILETLFASLSNATGTMVSAGDNQMHHGSSARIWQAMLAVSPIALQK